MHPTLLLWMLAVANDSNAPQGNLPPQTIDSVVQSAEPKQVYSSQKLSINWEATAQIIHGFGASTAWYGQYLTKNQINSLYNAKAAGSIGLSLLRMHINPDGTTDEFQPAMWAQQLGAVVWASPWTPRAEWKTNKSTDNGGSLLPANYSDYATQQVRFLKRMRSRGLRIRYLSAQNEPNYTAPWESCLWTAQQMATFIGDHLGPLLHKNLPEVKIIAPETNGFSAFPGYTQIIGNNKAALQYTAVFATHDYNGPIAENRDASTYKKSAWMTEVFVSDKTNGNDINLGLMVASKIHTSLTTAKMNAWHYWWLLPNPQSPQGGLIQNNKLSLRAYAMGNFAKFIRPGFVRLQVTPSLVQGSLLLSAYRSIATPKRLVIVGVNNNSHPAAQTVELVGFRGNTLRPYLTNQHHHLDKLAAINGVTKDQKHTFELKIPGNSIITWTNVNL